MKRLEKLYRNEKSRIVLRAVCFVFAFLLSYILAVLLPFFVDVPDAGYKAAHPYESFLGGGSDERALLMPTDEESFFARMVLTERAERSIDFATYDISLDDGTRHLSAALLKAADRGVRVRFFVDAKFGVPKGDEGKKLVNLFRSHENVEFYVFNEINLLRPAMLPVCMHDKIYSVDDRSLIVGGANMGWHHFISNADLEVMMTAGEKKSAAITQTNDYFEQLITSPLTRRQSEKQTPAARQYRETLDRGFAAYYGAAPFDKNRDYYADGAAVDKISLVTNPIEGVKRAPNVLEVIFTLAEQSERVHIRSPYITFGDGYNARLVRTAEGKQEFILATNSLYNSPNLAFGVYLRRRKQLLSPDVRLLEYQRPRQLHGKAAVFDDRLSAIGSFNMDERSAHIDTELMLVIDSVEFNKTLRAELDRYAADSLEVGPNNRYADGENAPAVPKSKQRLFGFYGIFFAPFVQLV